MAELRSQVIIKKRPILPKWARATVLLVILALIIWFVVVPQYGQAEQAFTSLKHISIPLILIAAILEVSSLPTYSAMTMLVLGRKLPNYFTLLLIDLTDLGVNHTIPGGGATATAVRFRLLKRAGLSTSGAITAATVQTGISNLVLGAIFVVGILLSIPSFVSNKYYTLAIIFIIGSFIGAIYAWRTVTHRTDGALKIFRKITGFLSTDRKLKIESSVRAIAEEIRTLFKSPRRMAFIIALAALNWLLDAAALWVLLSAFGYVLNPGALLTAYGLASILAMLPLTPGGIGIVEGVLIPSLVGFGVPGAIALIAVVGWRVFEYWLPIPLSAIAYTTLRLGIFRRPPKII